MNRKSLLFSLALLAFGVMLPATLVAQDGEPSRADLPDMHAFHVTDFELGCTDCHAIQDDPPAAQRLSYSVRPLHENCEVCHEEVFDEGEFVSFCLTCHIDDSFDLGEFPSGSTSLGIFNHQSHLDPQGRVSAQSGTRQDCVFCHPIGGSGVSLPQHNQCVACHSGSATVPPAIDEDGEGCLGCHSLQKIDHTIKNKGMEMMTAGALPAWLLARSQGSEMTSEQHAEARSYRGKSWHDVVAFPHEAHAKDRNGDGIDCVLCHESILTRTEIGALASYPTMSECEDCHKARDRVGTENHIDNCEVCHTEIRKETVPGEHGLMSGIRHDRGFVTSHSSAARDSDAYCSYCHGMAREDGAACAECHAQMKPETHVAARFAETTHGRLAAMDRENCAACHETDFCVRCHNIPPRSHYPLPLFVSGFHQDLAAFNLRSCFACHEFEAECQECHARELRIPGN